MGVTVQMRNLKARLARLPRTALKPWIIDSFHRFWYDSPDTWQRNTYLGFGVKQLPLDLWLYQELIYKLRPPFVLQTGISDGGSIVFFSHLLDLIGAPASAVVVGVDIQLTESARRIDHPRARLIEASSTDPKTIERIKGMLPAEQGFVSLDSDHARDHVRKELDLYAPFVALGSYLVVEDTNVHGHPVLLEHGPGPFEATEDFLNANSSFQRDDALWQRNLFSFHQYGWLKRVR